MERQYIVFGAEHYNPLGIVRSLGENKIKPIGIIIKDNYRITSASKYIRKRVHFVSSIEEGYQLILNNYANKDNPPFILTSDDKTTLFLNKHYNEIKDTLIFFNCGNNINMEYYMNKKNIGDLAVKHGLNFLENWKVKKGDISDGLSYPILTKSISSTVGAWKNDSYICNNKNELIEAYKKIKSEEVMLQKYIDKKNELAFEGFAVDSGNKVFLSIETDYDYLMPNYYSPYMTVHNIRNKQLIEPLKKMIKEIGFEGIFEAEFLIDQDDTIYFGEINFRNSTWSYASTVAGMPLPVLWTKEMIEISDDLEKYRLQHKDFHAIVELTDFKYRVLGKRINIFKWLYQFKKSKCKYYVGKHDIKPFFSSLKKRK